MSLYATPTNVFVSGHANPVQWQVFGQGSVATLNVTGSTWSEEINLLDVTHSGSGGIEAQLANILRGTGTVNADLDLLVPPYLNPPFILPGVSGGLAYYVSPTSYFFVPGTIQKVDWSSQVAGKVSYQFTVKLNSIVGQYVRPTT